jgi:hypothetical protein
MPYNVTELCAETCWQASASARPLTAAAIPVLLKRIPDIL